MEENSNLTPEERESFINKRRQRFNHMKIPVPTAPVQSVTTNVLNKDMLKKIQEIRNGNLKQEFKQFENKTNQNLSGGHVDVPVFNSKNKKPTVNEKSIIESENKKDIPKLEEFTSKPDPNLDAVKGLFEDSGFSSMSNYGKQASDIDGGSGFVNDIRSKFHEQMQKKISENTLRNNYQPQMQQIPLQSGMIMLNEEDLKKKIISIAKPVAKQVATEIIKQVLNEYLKTIKTPTEPIVATKVNESTKNKITQAEILPGNKIKINGKIYNIS